MKAILLLSVRIGMVECNIVDSSVELVSCGWEVAVVAWKVGERGRESGLKWCKRGLLRSREKERMTLYGEVRDGRDSWRGR